MPCTVLFFLLLKCYSICQALVMPVHSYVLNPLYIVKFPFSVINPQKYANSMNCSSCFPSNLILSSLCYFLTVIDFICFVFECLRVFECVHIRLVLLVIL